MQLNKSATISALRLLPCAAFSIVRTGSHSWESKFMVWGFFGSMLENKILKTASQSNSFELEGDTAKPLMTENWFQQSQITRNNKS